MSEEDDLQTGRLIAGRYRLTKKLGQGGMGSVWRAEHLTLGSDVAIKLIDQRIAQDTEVRNRFIREAQAAAKLRSPHVVQMLDYGVDMGMPFIAMELLSGESLADRLERLGRLSPEEASRVVTEVARALSLAHAEGIIHRDLKPDNIFLVENDDVELAKVLDFGVAKTQQYGTENASMTTTGAVLGTPYYMSPEQAEGAKDLDHRADIWALGVIAYECVVGLRPFDSETLGGLFLAICTRPKPVPSLLVKDVPAGFDHWFEKCTARLVADRFRTAKEAAAALKEVVEGTAIVPEKPPDPTPHGETAMSPEAWAKTNAAASLLTGSKKVTTTTAGVTGELPGVPQRSLGPLLAVLGLVLLGAGVAGFFVMRGDGSAQEQAIAVEEENAQGASSRADAEAKKSAASISPPSEPAQGPAIAPQPEPQPPEPVPARPASAPSPKATAPAPSPKTVVPRRTVEPAPNPAPAPVPRPRPQPAPKPKPAATPTPAPEPASDAINLGI